MKRAQSVEEERGNHGNGEGWGLRERERESLRARVSLRYKINTRKGKSEQEDREFAEKEIVIEVVRKSKRIEERKRNSKRKRWITERKGGETEWRKRSQQTQK